MKPSLVTKLSWCHASKLSRFVLIPLCPCPFRLIQESNQTQNQSSVPGPHVRILNLYHLSRALPCFKLPYNGPYFFQYHTWCPSGQSESSYTHCLPWCPFSPTDTEHQSSINLYWEKYGPLWTAWVVLQMFYQMLLILLLVIIFLLTYSWKWILSVNPVCICVSVTHNIETGQMC